MLEICQTHIDGFRDATPVATTLLFPTPVLSSWQSMKAVAHGGSPLFCALPHRSPSLQEIYLSIVFDKVLEACIILHDCEEEA
jgi:hypothetical protein